MGGDAAGIVKQESILFKYTKVPCKASVYLMKKANHSALWFLWDLRKSSTWDPILNQLDILKLGL